MSAANADAVQGDRVVAGRLAALKSGVRLVAVDVETCQEAGHPHRIVAVGMVTIRAGRRPGQYSTLVDPERPIDATTHAIHGIDDDAVSGWPTFHAVAPVVAQLLDAAAEQVVLVAHNVRFDVAVLKAEFDRVGATLPVVPVLDTASGAALDLLGVRRATNQLPDVAAALGVTVQAHHDALADALACSQIADALVHLAAERGYDDLAALLEDLTGGRTTDDVAAATARTAPGRSKHARQARRVDADHADTHATVLPAGPDPAVLDEWVEQLVECAALRCPLTVDRVAASDAPAAVRRAVVERALRGVLADEEVDAPAVATLLGAFAVVADGLPSSTGRLGLRRAAFAWADIWAGELDALDRCGRDACPDCRAESPCPLDTWREPLAELAFAESRERPRGVLRPNGKDRGTGSYTTWLRDGLDRQLADATLAVCVRAYRAAGSDEDLQAAIDLCHAVLATVGDSTALPVRRLHATHARLSGLQARRRGRDTGVVDEDGNVVYAPRHHPTDPKRQPRRRRFSA